MKSLSRARLFATPWIVACTKLLRPWDFQGKSTGVGCHFLLQGIFPTQGSNPGLSHCTQMVYHLSHQGSPLQFAHFTFFSIYVYRFIYLFAFWSSVLHELFSSCHQWGQLFAAELGLLIVEHGLSGSWGFDRCSSRAKWFRSLSSRAQAQKLWHTGLVIPWHVGSSRSGLEPMSPAFAGGFFTTEPPGKTCSFSF